MDGPHDLGGREGFGPIAVDQEGPTFSEAWEGRMFASLMTTGADDWTIDWFRHLIECLDPKTYLALPYFGKWAMAYFTGFVMSGVFTVEEILRGTTDERHAPPPPEDVERVLEQVRALKASYERPTTTPPAFAAGAYVRTVRHGTRGHTRLPAYARGREGRILDHRGAHVFPDGNAHCRPSAQHLYTVVFTARELWGPEADARDTVRLDHWESHFVPA
jgi:nitrile hydratase